MENRKRFVVADGNSLLFRAYYATAYGGTLMTRKDGLPTNAVFAFSNMMAKIVSGLKEGDALFVAFDKDGDTFRREAFASYKANRPPCPKELVSQFAPSRQLLDAMGIKHHEEHGLEADDLAGSMAILAEQAGYEVTLFTSDRDYLQLVGPHRHLELLRKGLSDTLTVEEGNIVELFGFRPEQTAAFKGLSGDPSDNLPGVQGIGEKTAVKLLQEYGTFEAIMEAAPNMKGKIGERLLAGKEDGYQSYELAKIKTDAPLPLKPEDCVYEGYKRQDVVSFMGEYEIKTLLGRLPSSWEKNEEKTEFSYEMPIMLPDMKERPDAIYLWLEGSSSYHEEDPVGLGIYIPRIGTYYLPYPDFLRDETILSLFKDPGVRKVTANAKALLYLCYRNDIPFEGLSDDIMLASYLLDAGDKETADQCLLRFGADSEGKTGEEGTCYRAFLLEKAVKEARKKLDGEKTLSIYNNLEIPLVSVLAEMEAGGFPLNKDMLIDLGHGFEHERDYYAMRIKDILGDVNPNSPKQLSAALYGENGILGKVNRGTGSDVLKELGHGLPIVEDILSYRKYAKLYSTYVEGILPYEKDGIVRTYFNQALTSTGRLSSSSPNLQNITTRDEEGKKVRNCFRYEDGKCLLSLDYSQIELRVLASLADCPGYIEIFKENHDVHSETARKIFHKEEITPAERRKAKAVNFAVVYGSTAFGLSEQIDGSVYEAKEIIDSFYASYPEIRTYLDNVVKNAQKDGYVSTMLGRRRYLPDLNNPSFAKKEAARRAAYNAPIQGSAADIMKLSMLKASRYLKESGLPVKMVLTIHDELIFSGSKEDLEKARTGLEKAMQEAYELKVPLHVEGGIGTDWGSCK